MTIDQLNITYNINTAEGRFLTFKVIKFTEQDIIEFAIQQAKEDFEGSFHQAQGCTINESSFCVEEVKIS
jgi:hypothetical protein